VDGVESSLSEPFAARAEVTPTPTTTS